MAWFQLHASARSRSASGRNSLPLHSRPHQLPIRVIYRKEIFMALEVVIGWERGGNRRIAERAFNKRLTAARSPH